MKKEKKEGRPLKLKKPSMKTTVVFAAIMFPLFALFCFALFHATAITRGKEAVLPIFGYDPRDLLSGHYLTFQIEFDADVKCRSALDTGKDRGYYSEKIGYYCMDKKAFVSDPKGCSVAIAGSCTYNRFDIGVNRFYIPEEYAETLDLLLRSSSRKEPKMKIVLSVTSAGRAYAKDMLIEDRPWKEWIRKPVLDEPLSRANTPGIDVSPEVNAVEVLEENGETIILTVPAMDD